MAANEIHQGDVGTIIRVTIKDGVTIMIAGLIKDENTFIEEKVPVLGDVPIVGGLFKSTSETKRRTETIIFLTPRIIDGSESNISFAAKKPIIGFKPDADKPALKDDDEGPQFKEE